MADSIRIGRPELTANTPSSSQSRAHSPAVLARMEQLLPALFEARISPAQFNSTIQAKPQDFYDQTNTALDLLAQAESELSQLRPQLQTLRISLDTSTTETEKARASAAESDKQHAHLLSQHYDTTEQYTRNMARKDEVIASLGIQQHLNQGRRESISRRTPEHPTPDQFTGENPKELDPFITKVNLKLLMNRDWWHTEADRMGFVISLIVGKAYKQIEHGIKKDGSITFLSVTAIFLVLETVYGDLNKKTDAAKRIVTLKQGHSSMVSFLPEWQTTANATDWDDKALIDILRMALHITILDRISYYNASDIPSTLPLFIEMIRKCDLDVRQAKPDYFKADRQQSSYTHPSRQFTNPPTTTAQPLDPGDPMDLNAATTPQWTKKDVEAHRIPKTEEEKDYKRAYCRLHDLCNWCYSKGHRATACKDAPWNREKV